MKSDDTGVTTHLSDQEIKVQRKLALEKRLRQQRLLPHLYGQKMYQWQLDFFESTNHANYLCAANQIGKSTCQIRKAIHWATNPSMWARLWRSRPRVFWYLYPSADVATIEWETKIRPDWMPREEMKEDPQYGWKEVRDDRKKIHSIVFNTGVTIIFKFYSVRVSNLQTATVWAIFCDEEIPVAIYSEVKIRLIGTCGYFHMVFTATLGQALWRAVLEGKGPLEKFPRAWKRQISLYDCLKYHDGTLTDWTHERILGVIEECKSETEVQRRVFGKFVSEDGLKYPHFDQIKNCMPPREIPQTWSIYGGVDIGSGGKTGHPSAIAYVGVNPTFTRGELFLGWRGDGVLTTAGDTLEKYIHMREPFAARVVEQRYDYHCRDFKTIADRVGEGFLPANKKHDEGENVLNTLFRYGALFIHLTEENYKLVYELIGLRLNQDKREGGDDFADALRYTVTSIPWDMDKIKIPKIQEKRIELTVDDERRERMAPSWKKKMKDEMQEDINFWNELMEA